MEASEPKRVNPVLNTIGVNSLRLEGLHLMSHNEILVTYYLLSVLYRKYWCVLHFDTIIMSYYFAEFHVINEWNNISLMKLLSAIERYVEEIEVLMKNQMKYQTVRYENIWLWIQHSMYILYIIMIN